MNSQSQSLEGRLWETLQAAAGMPEQINLAELLTQVDAAIEQLPELLNRQQWTLHFRGWNP